MKNRTILIVSLLMIAFLIGTSYTPQTALAKRQMQAEDIHAPEELLPFTKEDAVFDNVPVESDIDAQDGPIMQREEDSKLNGDSQIQTIPEWGFVSAVGINFEPHDSRITRYNGTRGCLGSGYDGTVNKTYSMNLNMPEDVKGDKIYFTYFNNVAEPANGPIRVVLFRRYWNSLNTEVVKSYRLEQTGEGGKSFSFSIDNITFDTNLWLYWIEFTLPNGTNSREFCGFQIAYKNHKIFPLGLPLVRNN